MFDKKRLELENRNTHPPFCYHISIFDIQGIMQDGATLPTYYTPGLTKLTLPKELKDRTEAQFHE